MTNEQDPDKLLAPMREALEKVQSEALGLIDTIEKCRAWYRNLKEYEDMHEAFKNAAKSLGLYDEIALKAQGALKASRKVVRRSGKAAKPTV